MNMSRWKPLSLSLLLLAAVTSAGETPATIIGRVTRGDKAAGPATIEATVVKPVMRRAGVVRHVAIIDAAGHFTLLGLPPAESYEVKITFADGRYSRGPLNDVRTGEVRHVWTNLLMYRHCAINYWVEEPDRSPQQVFVWPLRDRRNNMWVCE